MSPDANATGNHELPHEVPKEISKGLPPVTPPSGRFIVQLFLIPGLIVTIGVLFALIPQYLLSTSYTPESLLAQLDSANPDVRWRGAHELAQVLERPESLALASDAKFALDLAERLQKALDDLDTAEKAAAKELEKLEAAAKKKGESFSQAERQAHWRKLRPQRDHVSFLIGCLGHFTVPVGAPLLCDIATHAEGAEIKGLTLRRRKAVSALANLGDTIKRRYFGEKPQPSDKVLTEEQRDAVLAQLRAEAAAGEKRGEWAKSALDYLQKKRPIGVEAAMETCAAADDPFLRQLAAVTLSFWDGDRQRIERTLLRLARDDGRGKLIQITEDD